MPSRSFLFFLYLMAFALFESVLVTFVLIVIAFVLPVAWFGEGFAYKAPVPVLVGAFALMRLQNSVSSGSIPTFRTSAAYALAILVLCALVIFVLHRWSRLHGMLQAVLERFEIFGYIYVPLGLLGILVVLLRNILG